MASLITRGKSYAVQLSPNENPKRPLVTLGRALGKRRKKGETGYTEQEALLIKANIESLVLFQHKAEPLNNTLTEWLSGLSDTHRSRLEAIGLIQREEKNKDYTVIEWAERFVKLKQQNKSLADNTKKKYVSTLRKIKGFFKSELLSEVSPELALKFRYYLQGKGELNENSTRKHIRLTSEMFRFAVENGIITNNPFKGQKTAILPNPERFFFITPEIAQKVLEACPDTEWKLIFALARYGGLRTPSETFRLKWEDVNFENEKFTIHASKTAHHESGGIRSLPIFPELKPLLLQAFEEAKPGEEYVISKYRGENLRTQFTRIIKRAGLKPWPKLFQNCRSTRETELFKLTKGNIKAVCSWIGNSPEIALKHYAQITDADSREAAKLAVLETAETCVHQCMHESMHTGGVSECKELQVSKDMVIVSSSNCKSLHKKSGSLQDVAKSRLVAPRRIELLFPG